MRATLALVAILVFGIALPTPAAAAWQAPIVTVESDLVPGLGGVCEGSFSVTLALPEGAVAGTVRGRVTETCEVADITTLVFNSYDDAAEHMTVPPRPDEPLDDEGFQAMSHCSGSYSARNMLAYGHYYADSGGAFSTTNTVSWREYVSECLLLTSYTAECYEDVSGWHIETCPHGSYTYSDTQSESWTESNWKEDGWFLPDTAQARVTANLYWDSWSPDSATCTEGGFPPGSWSCDETIYS